MDPCLSLTSCKAGSGWQGPTLTALISAKCGYKTALLSTRFGVNLLQARKREMKTLDKEEQEIPSSSQKSGDHKESETNYKYQSAAPSIDCQDSSLRGTKRRRISEDSETSLISKNSSIQVSSTSTQCQDSKSTSGSLSSPGVVRDQNSSYSQKEESNTHQPSLAKIPSKMSDGSADSVVTSKGSLTLQQSLLQKSQNLWEVFNGRLLSSEILRGRGGNDSLGFECCNKHQFIISLLSLAKLTTFSTQDQDCCETWWLKCRNFIRKTKERADSMNSQIVSSGLDKTLIVAECENKHRIELRYSRNYAKIWWEQCILEAREKQSKAFKEQEQAEEERKQKEQQRIFQESYRKMFKEEQPKNTHFSSRQEAQYYERIMKEVCICAKKKMEAEMSSSSFKGETTHIEIYNVYKIIYMPIEILIKTLWMIDKSLLSSHYRQLALILHPDKNKHSYANEAFLKLTNAFDACKLLANSA